MHAPPHHADPDPWTERAACRDTDPETFFPLPGASGGLDREAIAKRLCGRCPVARECLREALVRDEGAGIWGGFNARERRELLRVAGTLESTGAELAAYLAGGGRRLSATPRERPAYVWYLRRHGWTPRRIAGALGISFGQVQQAWQLAELASSCTRGPVSGMPTPRAPRKRVRRSAGEQGVVGVERPEIRSGVTALGRTPLSGYATRGRATTPARPPIPPAGGHPAGPVPTDRTRSALTGEGRATAGAAGGTRGAAPVEGRRATTGGARGAVPVEGRRAITGATRSAMPTDGRRATTGATRSAMPTEERRLPGGTSAIPPRGPLAPDGRRATNPVVTNPPRGPLAPAGRRATNPVPTNPPRGPLSPAGRRAQGAIPAQPARGPVASDDRRMPGPAAGDPSHAPLTADGRRARGPAPAQPGRGPLTPDGQRTPGATRNPSYAPPAPDGQHTPIPRAPAPTPLTPDGRRTPAPTSLAPEGQRTRRPLPPTPTPAPTPRDRAHTPVDPEGPRVARPLPLNPSPEPLGWEARREVGVVSADRMRALLALKARRLPERPRVTLTSGSAQTFVAPGSPRITITIRPVPGNPRGGTS
ncbi:WhiB family transcriptional regulator [Streptomyces sp. NPDC003635]